MKVQEIFKINGISIQVCDDDEHSVPIKPICQALGLAFSPQRTKIAEDEILGSVVTLSVTTGADGKSYEMVCLPEKYVYGWLFTINPQNVSEEARPNVIKYRRECYDALYDYYHRKEQIRAEEDSLEAEAFNEVEAAKRNVAETKQAFDEAKARQKDAEDKLESIRQKRIDRQQQGPNLFER